MGYTKTGLQNGDKVYAEDVEHVEDGILQNEQNIAYNEKSIEDLDASKADKGEIPDVSELTEQVQANTENIAKKANQSDLEALSEIVESKADQTTVDSLSETIESKADKDDLDDLKESVEQNTADIEEIKKNGAGGTVDLSEIEAEIKDLQDIKADKSEVTKIWSEIDKIWDAIDELSSDTGGSEAFAIYSADDNSLTFYTDNTVPEEGDTYKDKTVTYVYTGLESTGTSSSSIPWFSNRSNVKSIEFDRTFKNVQVQSIKYWFYGASNCKEITGLCYLNTSAVTDMESMFDSCSSLTSIDVSGLDTSAVTNMKYMFNGCSGLTSLNVSGLDTSAVTNMSRMFNTCSNLTSVDMSGLDTSAVTDMSYMFNGCSNLITIYSDDNNFVTTKVTSGSNMFYRCSNLIGGNGTAYDSSNVTYTMAHVDTASNPGYFTAK